MLLAKGSGMMLLCSPANDLLIQVPWLYGRGAKWTSRWTHRSRYGCVLVARHDSGRVTIELVITHALGCESASCSPSGWTSLREIIQATHSLLVLPWL